MAAKLRLVLHGDDMGRNIDKDVVRRMARLSRMEISDEQAQAFAAPLGQIIGYFDKLQELDTANVEPMVHPIELSNVLADDVPGKSLTPDQALANAPAREGDFFKTPKVIDSD